MPGVAPACSRVMVDHRGSPHTSQVSTPAHRQRRPPMSANTITRVQPGVPSGGQFAANAHAETDVSLGAEPDASIVDRDSPFTQRYDTLDEKLTAIHGELEGRVAALAEDDDWNRYLDTMSRFHHYSFSNQMLIAMQTKSQATRVAGFKTWQGMNRQVRKGEKGIAILAPKTIRKDATDSAGKPIVGPDGKPAKKSVVIGFTAVSVFDVSQTDGEPLPDGESMTTLSEEPPPGFQEDLTAAITESGYAVSYDDIPGSARGFTDPHSHRVVIRSGMSEANQVNTLAHELGHIKVGHIERLDEYHSGHNGNRGAFEVEAESISYVLCRNQGMSPDVGDKSGRYVAGWGNTDPEAVRRSAEHVQKTVKTILGSGRWRNSEGDQS